MDKETLACRRLDSNVLDTLDKSSYECQCIDGIIGSNCEINMDECLSSPCIRGVCVDGINKFTCNCPHGYEGVLCDIEINECER